MDENDYDFCSHISNLSCKKLRITFSVQFLKSRMIISFRTSSFPIRFVLSSNDTTAGKAYIFNQVYVRQELFWSVKQYQFVTENSKNSHAVLAPGTRKKA